MLFRFIFNWRIITLQHWFLPYIHISVLSVDRGPPKSESTNDLLNEKKRLNLDTLKQADAWALPLTY